MTINTPNLAPNHPLLQDGMNDGFRAPDLGWVGSKGDGAGLEAEQFEPGSLLFANFWAGPIEQAKQFAEALVQDFQKWLPDMTPEEEGEEFSPVVSVSYWEDPATGLALVATQSLTPDFMIDEVPESFESFDAFDGDMQQVAFDGNDNSPHEALGEISRLEGVDRKALSALILACVPDDERDEIRAFYEEQGEEEF